ncbi:MAG: GNAT family N-acetyltransferase [Firmicutes bacterium]|nr:GNAT family N-acetyltransferase [Bacillota bacterium]
MCEIRTVEPDDFRHLLMIEAESFTGGYSPYFLKMAPTLFGNTSLLAIKGRSPLGYIMCAREQGNPGRAWIMSLAVRPKARNQGLGEKLLVQTLDILKAEGVQDVKLSVEPDNHTALGIYQRHGFTACKTVDDFFGPGQHRLLLKKILE